MVSLCPTSNHTQQRNTEHGLLLEVTSSTTRATPACLRVPSPHTNCTAMTLSQHQETADIANYYLNTPLPQPEYMKIHISLIREEIIQAYKLWEKVEAKGWVHIRIKKGMYGLPQAGILAYERTVSCPSGTAWLLTGATHTRVLETRQQTYLLCPCCGRFLGQVHQQG